jgi:hypothetical protein
MVLRLYCHTAYVLYGFIPVPVKGRVFTVMGMVMENWNHSIPVNNPKGGGVKPERVRARPVLHHCACLVIL